MYSKIFLNSIFALALVICQLAFISGLPWWFSKINLILAVLVFILALRDFKTAAVWVIVIGFLLDLYSFLPFGFYLVGLFLTLLLADFLLTGFFTDRSLYSFLALIFFSTIFYEFFLNLMIYFGNFFSERANFFLLEKSFWLSVSAQIILNSITVFCIFYVISFVSKKLKPVFLIRNKK